jgi:hypothetical protein
VVRPAAMAGRVDRHVARRRVAAAVRGRNGGRSWPERRPRDRTATPA